MKKRRPHSIPLSDHPVTFLEPLKTHSGHREHVFPADRNPRTYANSQTANMALKRTGFQDRLVSHDMRLMASAYNRADYIERRRPVMAW
jgi:integrase